MSGEATVSVTAALFGLDGFVVLAAADAGGELEMLVETTADLVVSRMWGGGPGQGPAWDVGARFADRGRPVVICWNKRIWCCPHAWCAVKTWTEVHPAIAPRGVSDRAGPGPGL